MKKSMWLLLVGVLFLFSLSFVSAADSCVDTDGSGTAFAVKGVVTVVNVSGTSSYTDSCLTTKKLQEYSCNGTKVDTFAVNCSKALSYSSSTCSSGACSTKSSSSNSTNSSSKSAPGLDSVGSSSSSLFWVLGIVALLLIGGAYWYFKGRK